MKAIHKQRPYLKYVLALVCLSAVYTADCQGLHDHSFRDINGKNIRLKDFAGKKLLFIILPLSTADSLVTQLKSFVATYGDKIQVFGILSREDGYSESRKTDVKAAYQHTGILVTDVMGSRKGSSQSPLLKWLTSKNENGHFDMDATGPGQKFFVNEHGKLYAVLGGKLSLSSSLISKIVNTTEGNEQAVPVKGK